MNPQSAKEAISHLVKRKVPLFLWGPPGIGKSSIVKQIARESGIECIDLRLSLLDPTDLRGIPFFDPATSKAIWASASFLPQDSNSKGILFLDELNTAAPMVQASAYQLILDRKIGEYTLPDGWAIVAAGNRESDRGVVFRMAAPLANRFVHLDMQTDANEWIAWAKAQGVLESIIAFISYRPDALFAFNANTQNKAFATPRTWSYVDEILKSNPTPELLSVMVQGAIGEELGSSFLGFCASQKELPDIQKILSGESFEVPQESAALHILATALMMRINDETRAKELNTLLNYTLKLPAEFAIMIIQDLRSRNIELDYLESWALWSRQFNKVLH